MKKLILPVAVLALLASCSKNEVTSLPQSNEIGFSTLNDRVVSKAANDAGADYKVYATNSGAAGKWAINDYVTEATSATPDAKTEAKAPKSGPYFWPADDATMSFYAYAPYTTTTATSNSITPTIGADAASISLAYAVPSAANEDFTVATPVKAKTSADNGGVVDFNFKHMLAKVSVVVKLDNATGGSLANYEITGADFTTTFDVKESTFTVDAMADEPAGTPATTAVDPAAYTGAKTYMIAPQAFAGCTLQINGISVTQKETGISFFPSKVADLSVITLVGDELAGTNGAEFEAGNHYVFTVTIDKDSTEEGEDKTPEIKFTAATTAWSADLAGTLTQE